MSRARRLQDKPLQSDHLELLDLPSARRSKDFLIDAVRRAQSRQCRRYRFRQNHLDEEPLPLCSGRTTNHNHEDVRELFLPCHENCVHMPYSRGGQGVAIREGPGKITDTDPDLALKIWGDDPRRALKHVGEIEGDHVVVASGGRTAVKIERPVRDETGKVLGLEQVELMRNSWDAMTFERLRDDAQARVVKQSINFESSAVLGRLYSCFF